MLGRSNGSGGGSSSSGTIGIIENGNYNVSNYANAEVAIPNIPSFTYVGQKATTATNGTYTTTIDGLTAGSDYGCSSWVRITSNIGDEEHNMYYLYNCNSSISLNTSHNQPNVHIVLKISYYKVNYSAG